MANKNLHPNGRAQFDNLTGGTQVVVRINCLSVFSDSQSGIAIISGRVLHSDDPRFPQRQDAIFAAVDDPRFPADRITPLFPLSPFAGPQNCHETQPNPLLTVEDGDIEIQP